VSVAVDRRRPFRRRTTDAGTATISDGVHAGVAGHHALPLIVAVAERLSHVIRAGAAATVVPAQRAALVDLYVATNGAGWTVNTGWRDYATGSDPCENSWAGVSCSGSAGSSNRGVSVDLSSACRCRQSYFSVRCKCRLVQVALGCADKKHDWQHPGQHRELDSADVCRPNNHD
jgi:hypothetical protein